jgi:hypothetical protein
MLENECYGHTLGIRNAYCFSTTTVVVLTRLNGVAFETWNSEAVCKRSGGEGGCEGNSVLWLFKVVPCAIFFCEHEIWTFKMCERQNTIVCALISGTQAFRLVRFMNGFMLKCVLLIRK